MGNGKSEAESRGHYKLEAWKLSMELVRNVYRLTQPFPKEEMFGLTSQMRRAAASIPSNIAEARGSLSELETQLLIAVDLGYIKKDDHVFHLLDRVSRLITGLHKTVRS